MKATCKFLVGVAYEATMVVEVEFSTSEMRHRVMDVVPLACALKHAVTASWLA